VSDAERETLYEEIFSIWLKKIMQVDLENKFLNEFNFILSRN
jgi:hypothetical protein